MTVKAFFGAQFDRQHEMEIFEDLFSRLKRKWEASEELVVLIGNVFCGAKEIDAIIVKKDSISVIEFKNYGGKITGGRNGTWEADDIEISYSNKGDNPYKQVSANRYAARNWFRKNNLEIVENKNHIINYNHTKAIVIFHQRITFDINSWEKDKDLRWFNVTDIENVLSLLDNYRIKSNEISFTNREILNIVNVMKGIEYQSPSEISVSETAPSQETIQKEEMQEKCEEIVSVVENDTQEDKEFEEADKSNKTGQEQLVQPTNSNKEIPLESVKKGIQDITDNSEISVSETAPSQETFQEEEMQEKCEEIVSVVKNDTQEDKEVAETGKSNKTGQKQPVQPNNNFYKKTQFESVKKVIQDATDNEVLINIVEINKNNNAAVIDHVTVRIKKTSNNSGLKVTVLGSHGKLDHFKDGLSPVAIKHSSYPTDNLDITIVFNEGPEHDGRSCGLPVAFAIYYCLFRSLRFVGGYFKNDISLDEWLMTGEIDLRNINIKKVEDIEQKIDAFINTGDIKHMIIPIENWNEDLRDACGQEAPLTNESKLQIVNVKDKENKTIYLISKFSDIDEIFKPIRPAANKWWKILAPAAAAVVILTVISFSSFKQDGKEVERNTQGSKVLAEKDVEISQNVPANVAQSDIVPPEVKIEEAERLSRNQETKVTDTGSQKSGLDHANKPNNKPVSENKPSIDIPKHFTSLVIDLRGQEFPAGSIEQYKIRSVTKDRPIYNRIKRIFQSHRNSFYLAASLNDAALKYPSIIGENPLKVLAGEYMIDIDNSRQVIYIPETVHRNIEKAVKHHDFLEEGKVILLIDDSQ